MIWRLPGMKLRPSPLSLSLEVRAPPGRLGVQFAERPLGGVIVRAVHRDSALLGQASERRARAPEPRDARGAAASPSLTTRRATSYLFLARARSRPR